MSQILNQKLQLLLISAIVTVGLLMSFILSTKVQASIEDCTTTPPAGTINGNYVGTTHTSATLINHSTRCSYQVGIASYKAYLPYSNGTNKSWIYTQTYFASRTVQLLPGHTITLTVPVPTCAWQTDIFWGKVIKIFTPTQLYSVQGRLIDGGWYETRLPVCVKLTLTSTPTPTYKPTPTATPQPTATPTLPQVLGVTSLPTSTPTPVEITPPTNLPSTGPGDILAVTLLSLVGGLIGLKYWRLP